MNACRICGIPIALEDSTLCRRCDERAVFAELMWAGAIFAVTLGACLLIWSVGA